MSATVSFPTLLQRFFTQRLMQQRRASPHTIGSYRDTFRLLLHFAQARLGKPPTQLAFEQIDAPFVAAFLEDLENGRGIAARTRNLRLTAIRSFFRYAAFEAPAHAAQIQRVLAIPSQRFMRAQVGFLTQTGSRGACLLLPISTPGPDAVITPCSWSPFKAGCACPSSPQCAARP